PDAQRHRWRRSCDDDERRNQCRLERRSLSGRWSRPQDDERRNQVDDAVGLLRVARDEHGEWQPRPRLPGDGERSARSKDVGNLGERRRADPRSDDEWRRIDHKEVAVILRREAPKEPAVAVILSEAKNLLLCQTLKADSSSLRSSE